MSRKSGQSSPRCCSVKLCSNSYQNCKLSLFRFPKDLERRKIWIRFARRPEFLGKNYKQLDVNARICADHFEEKQFLNPNVRNRLITCAIPTLFKKIPQLPRDVILPESVRDQSERSLTPFVLVEELPKERLKELKNEEDESSDSDEDYVISTEDFPSDDETIYSKIEAKEDVSAVYEMRDMTNKRTEPDICAAMFCASDSKKSKNITFFPFPRDFERCMSWARNAGREDLLNKTSDQLNKTMILCSIHFEDDQFFNPPNKKRLRWDAVPTIFKTNTLTIRGPQGSSSASCTFRPLPQTSGGAQSLISFPIDRPRMKPPVKAVVTTESSLQFMSKFLPDSSLSLLKIHLQRTKKRMKWTRNGRRLAIILYVHFYARYRALSKMFSLPSISVVEKWLRKEEFFPGIHTDHIRMLHDSDIFDRCKNVDLRLEKKAAVLVLRRIALDPQLTYDSKLDRIEGLQDLDYLGKVRYVATHAMVFTAKGLFTKWRLPVGYFPISKWATVPLMAKLLFDTLYQLESTGLQIRVLVVANSSFSSKLLKYFAVSTTRPFIYFMGRKVLVMYDPPTLLKKLLYEFQLSNIVIGDKIASWKHLENFYAVDSAQKFPLAPELTSAHFEWTKYSDLTRKIAVDIFQDKVAAGLNYATQIGTLKDVTSSTSELIQLVADSYKCFSRKLCHNESPQPKYLTSLLNKMKSLSFVNESEGCMDGWILSMNSLIQLWYDTKTKQKNKTNSKLLRIKDVKMKKTIKKMVGEGSLPSSSLVRQSMKELSVNTLMKPTQLKCLKLENVYFPKVIQRLSAEIKTNDKILKMSKIIRRQSVPDFPKENSSSVIGGYLVTSIFEKHVCHICGSKWVQQCCLSIGAIELYVLWLERTQNSPFTKEEVVVPSQDLMKLIYKCEQIFSQYFSRVIHMDQPGKRLVRVLRRNLKLELKDMCQVARKEFLNTFVNCQILRSLTVYNSKKRNRKRKLISKFFLTK